jgi:hypothetical protein
MGSLGISGVVSRTVTALVGIGTAAAAVAVIAAPDAALSAARGLLTAAGGLPSATFAAGAAAVGAVGLLLALAAIWPWGQGMVFTARVDGAVIEYPAGLVARVVEDALSVLDGVQRSGVAVGGRGRGQKVALQVVLAVSPEADAQALAGRAAATAREVAGRLGLEVEHLRIAIQPARGGRNTAARRTAAAV